MRAGKYIRECQRLGLNGFVGMQHYVNAVDPDYEYARWEAGVFLMGVPLRLNGKGYSEDDRESGACDSAWNAIEDLRKGVATSALREALKTEAAKRGERDD